MYRHIPNLVQLGSKSDPCYIQNRVVTKCVIKRSRYTSNRTIKTNPAHVKNITALQFRTLRFRLFLCSTSVNHQDLLQDNPILCHTDK